MRNKDFKPLWNLKPPPNTEEELWAGNGKQWSSDNEIHCHEEEITEIAKHLKKSWKHSTALSWICLHKILYDPKWSLVKNCRQFSAGRARAEQPKGCAELAPPGAEKMNQGTFQSSQTQICCKLRLKGKFQSQNPPVTGIWEVSSGRGFAADSSAGDVQMTQVSEIAGGDTQIFLWLTAA